MNIDKVRVKFEKVFDSPVPLSRAKDHDGYQYIYCKNDGLILNQDMKPLWRETMDNKYTIIDLSNDGYKSFGYNFSENFANQLKARLEPSIKEGVDKIVSELFGKVSEERYSEVFYKTINSAFSDAVKSERFQLNDKNIEELYIRAEKANNEITAIKETAKFIYDNLSEIEMSGNPARIASIVDFIQKLAEGE